MKTETIILCGHNNFNKGIESLQQIPIFNTKYLQPNYADL